MLAMVAAVSGVSVIVDGEKGEEVDERDPAVNDVGVDAGLLLN